ncbi:MAG: DUF4301 family protein [Bacteroidales bacterium]
MEFRRTDLEQFEQKGINKSTVEKQIRNFIHGFPFANLEGAATPERGILVCAPEQVDKFVRLYEKRAPGMRLEKFVPASGAASRMFRHLFSVLQDYEEDKVMIDRILSDDAFHSAGYFLNNLEKFAFYLILRETVTGKGHDFDKLIEHKEYRPILEALLTEEGMNYGSLPKGLLYFHMYEDGPRHALEEHLVEGAFYCRERSGKVSVHFTVSPEHMERFRRVANREKGKHENAFGVVYDISYSVQKPTTDTVAVDMDNEPFRLEDGSILFRPGGHGALIENLNDLHADLIFIKNIDNVVPDRLKTDTYKYKKLLGGILLDVQETVFDYLEKIENGRFNENDLLSIKEFMQDRLLIRFPDDFNDLDLEKQFGWIEYKLNRPIRVCGMVKNEGEPGGGPFWVINDRGEISLQIVEKSQIDPDDPRQVEIMNRSTHFNPVDLVCATKNYKGEKFNLKSFVDPETGFISQKSRDGRDLKALELPGLWNGAMAGWNTIFVEVPIITFNPVKSVNDLLREQHQ